MSEVHPARPWNGETLKPWLRVTRDEPRPAFDADFPEPITSETFHLTDDLTAPREHGATITLLASD